MQLPEGENVSVAFDAAGEGGASGIGLMNTREFANSPLYGTGTSDSERSRAIA
jgi:hypothetical protein